MTPGWAARPRYWVCEHMRECSCVWGLGEKMWAALPLPCSELRAHLSSWSTVKFGGSRGASLKVPQAGQPPVKGSVSIICPPVFMALLDLWVRRGMLSTASTVRPGGSETPGMPGGRTDLRDVTAGLGSRGRHGKAHFHGGAGISETAPTTLTSIHLLNLCSVQESCSGRYKSCFYVGILPEECIGMVMEEGVEKRQIEKPPPLFPSVIIYETVWVGGSNRQGAESCLIKRTVKKKLLEGLAHGAGSQFKRKHWQTVSSQRCDE